MHRMATFLRTFAGRVQTDCRLGPGGRGATTADERASIADRNVLSKKPAEMMLFRSKQREAIGDVVIWMK